MSSSQYLRHSESLIHPLLRVLWQLDLETRIFGVQGSWVSGRCVKRGGGRAHVVHLCCWRAADNLQGDKVQLVIFCEWHVYQYH